MLPSLNRMVSLIDYANKGAFINLDPHEIYVIWRGVEYTTSHKISSQSTGQSGSYSNSKKLPSLNRRVSLIDYANKGAFINLDPHENYVIWREVEYTTSHKISSQSTGQSGSYSNSKKLPSLNRRVSLIDYVNKGAFINLDPHEIYVIWRGVEYTTSHKISSQSTGQSGSYSISKKLPSLNRRVSLIDYANKGAFINLDPHDIYVIWRGVEYTTSHKISSQSTGQSGSYSNSKKLPSLNRRVSLIDYANKGALINLDPHDIYVIWRGVEYTTSHKISSQSTRQSGSYSNSKKLPSLNRRVSLIETSRNYANKGAFINLDPHEVYVIWRGVEYTTSHKISSQSTGQSGNYSNSKKLPSLNRRVSLIDYANKGAFINLDPHDIYVIWRGVEYTTSHKISSQSTGQSGSYSNSKKLPSLNRRVSLIDYANEWAFINLDPHDNYVVWRGVE